MIYLLIEFIDELVFGVGEAAWPLIRSDLHLNYIQIGLALSLPGFLANFIEPFLFILGDVWKRRVIILAGGIFFTLSLFLTGISTSFLFLLSSISWLKLVIVGLMGFFNAGWYAILKAKLFETMHGQSGAAQALDNVSGLIGKLIPFGIGIAAQIFGLGIAMWLLLAGPIALLIGLPRRMSPLPEGEG